MQTPSPFAFLHLRALPDAIRAVEHANQRGVALPKDALLYLLAACCKLKDITSARELHRVIVESGMHTLPLVAEQLIRMFAVLGCLQESNLVFDSIPHPTVYTWNAIITAHVDLGRSWRALCLYECMQKKCCIPDKFTYLCTLKACVKLRDCRQGERIHDSIIRSGLDSDITLMNSVIDFYAKCLKLLDASNVFSRMQTRNVVSWSALIAGYAAHGDGFRVLELYCQMQTFGEEPHEILLTSLVKACGMTGALVEGRWIHDKILRLRFDSNTILGGALIDMYAKCRDMPAAQRLFEKLKHRDAVSWASLIGGYTASEMSITALERFAQFLEEKMVPDRYIFSSVLKACSGIRALNEGMWIHDRMIRAGLDKGVVVMSALVTIYGACGDTVAASNVFDRMPDRNALSWGGLILCHVQQGYDILAISLFTKMQDEGVRPDKVIFICMLQACTNIGSIVIGFTMHQHIVSNSLDRDHDILKHLINMYIECGNLDDARKYYSILPDGNVETWTLIIQGYCRIDQCSLAVELFEHLHQNNLIIADNVLFMCILKACGRMGALDKGRQLQSQIVGYGMDLELTIGCTLVDMYGNCERLDEAWKIFKNLTLPDVIAWGAMLAGCMRHGYTDLALELYEKLLHTDIKPDKLIFSCILKACGQTQDIQQGHILHDQIVRTGLMSDSVIENIIIDMYARCECLAEAHKIFDGQFIHDVVSWATIITGYIQMGEDLRGLKLFERMQQEDIKADSVIHSSVLKACGSVNDLENGMVLHKDILTSGWETNELVGSALICMYGKCGQLQDAQRVFDRLEVRDEISWGVMIAAFAKHGQEVYALTLHEEMQQECLQPKNSTILWVFKACGDTGVLEHGQQLHSHITKTGSDSDVSIVNSIINMYTKCGSMDESMHVFNSMSCRDAMTWGTMIAATLTDKNRRALFEKLAEQKEQEKLDDGSDDVLLVRLLSACRQVGLIDEGLNCFKYTHNVVPNVEQYGCLADLLGRVGCLEMAKSVIQTMPVQEDVLMWTALLNSCRTYGNKSLAKYCLEHILRLDPDDTSGYVLIASMYSDAEVQDEDLHPTCWKEPGCSFYDDSSSIPGGNQFLQNVCGKQKRSISILTNNSIASMTGQDNYHEDYSYIHSTVSHKNCISAVSVCFLLKFKETFSVCFLLKQQMTRMRPLETVDKTTNDHNAALEGTVVNPLKEPRWTIAT